MKATDLFRFAPHSKNQKFKPNSRWNWRLSVVLLRIWMTMLSKTRVKATTRTSKVRLLQTLSMKTRREKTSENTTFCCSRPFGTLRILTSSQMLFWTKTPRSTAIPRKSRVSCRVTITLTEIAKVCSSSCHLTLWPTLIMKKCSLEVLNLL